MPGNPRASAGAEPFTILLHGGFVMAIHVFVGQFVIALAG